ncbi:MAG: hypothetical protein ACE5HU_07600 [Acidobacteriota bacterium]
MSDHGRVILSRMVEMIDRYEDDHRNLRGLVDDLSCLYQSLEPAEQPPERPWLDALLPLERLLGDRQGVDARRMRAHIDRHVSVLRELLVECQRAG